MPNEKLDVQGKKKGEKLFNDKIILGAPTEGMLMEKCFNYIFKDVKPNFIWSPLKTFLGDMIELCTVSNNFLV